MEGRREGGREGASFFPNQELTPKNLKIESFKAVSLEEKESERMKHGIDIKRKHTLVKGTTFPSIFLPRSVRRLSA